MAERTLAGLALIAMEAPLIRKVEQYQTKFGYTWSELSSYLLLLDGVQVSDLDIRPGWAPAETVQPRTQAEIRQFAVASGLPLETILRRDEHWTSDEIDDMQADRANTAAQQTNLGAELLSAFDRGTV